jgi:hypothetical protein
MVCRLLSPPTLTDGGPERRVVKDLSSSDWGNGDVSAERLYFIRRTDDGPRIVFRGAGSGEAPTVASIPNTASPSLEVAFTRTVPAQPGPRNEFRRDGVPAFGSAGDPSAVRSTRIMGRK